MSRLLTGAVLSLSLLSGCASPEQELVDNSLGPATLAVLAALRDDTSALAYVGVGPEAAGSVVERPRTPPDLGLYEAEIRRSARCAWRDLSRDSLYLRAMQVNGSGLVGSDRAAAPGTTNAQLIAFVSPEVDRMRLVTFFSVEPERERFGGDFRQYASFNVAIDYLVCGDSEGLEVVGPKLWIID